MVSTVSFLLLLPAIVYGNFTIDIDLRGNKPLIDIRGHFSSVINDTDREAFQIGDKQLIDAVTKYGNGTVPDKVYVKRNEKLLSMYNKHNFFDVVRHIKPVLDVKYDEIRCSKPENLKSDQADMTVSTEWKTGGSLSDKIRYDMYVSPNPLPITFSTLPGKTLDNVSKPYKFGKTVDFASKCTLKIYVNFESTLEGDVVAQYPYKREKHFFWAYDLARVQEKANLTTSYKTEEIITIVYFQEKPALSRK